MEPLDADQSTRTESQSVNFVSSPCASDVAVKRYIYSKMQFENVYMEQSSKTVERYM